MKKILALLLLLLLGAAGYSLFQPYRGFSGDLFVEIPKGTGTSTAARMLAQAGVIRYNWQFLLARAMQPQRRLQAGEYRFQKAASVWEVFGRIARGDTFYYDFTVAEGKNIFDIATSIEALGLITREEFLQAANDPSSIHDLDPEAKSLEGYLFPAAYKIAPHLKAPQICALMTAQFRRQLAKLETDIPAHKLVTIASIIEKETGLPEERSQVSSVYWNRLKKGMRLEADPTTIYAALLDGRYRGKIYRSDLESQHPYNTYRHSGLPPGPIANPGLASLKAAIAPAETAYLYFVAQPGNSGASTFSTTLAAHQRAVAEYRHGKQQKAGAQTMAARRAPAASH